MGKTRLSLISSITSLLQHKRYSRPPPTISRNPAFQPAGFRVGIEIHDSKSPTSTRASPLTAILFVDTKEPFVWYIGPWFRSNHDGNAALRSVYTECVTMDDAASVHFLAGYTFVRGWGTRGSPWTKTGQPFIRECVFAITSNDKRRPRYDGTGIAGQGLSRAKSRFGERSIIRINRRGDSYG